mmetsp:Transcript_62514/g.202651  ORF Transcript_62514/g.202651 Transcript_62514/m.202651 type:complete len:231 (+) Transcript_62514:1184-1876(+)
MFRSVPEVGMYDAKKRSTCKPHFSNGCTTILSKDCAASLCARTDASEVEKLRSPMPEPPLKDSPRTTMATRRGDRRNDGDPPAACVKGPTGQYCAKSFCRRVFVRSCPNAAHRDSADALVDVCGTVGGCAVLTSGNPAADFPPTKPPSSTTGNSVAKLLKSANKESTTTAAAATTAAAGQPALMNQNLQRFSNRFVLAIARCGRSCCANNLVPPWIDPGCSDCHKRVVQP